MVQADLEVMQEWSAEAKELAEFLSVLCAPPSSEPTEDWAEKNVQVVDGPFAGSNWRLSFTPFAKWIFAARRDPNVRRVVLMMSAQYLKTTAIMIDFLRSAKEDPADTMWVMAEADNITEFFDKRLMPYIESCPVVLPLFVRKSKNLVQLEGMNLMLRGSNSTAKLRSDPIRDIYCDERADWKQGSIQKLRMRLTTFPNYREFSAGTAGIENDELHADYIEGSQTRAHISCLQCGHSQPIRFGREATALWPNARECGGFVGWSNQTNPGIEDLTRPNGQWDYEQVRKHVRFECENPACRARYDNSQKYELIRTMHPHDYNPSAPSSIKSFGGSALEAIWESCDWDKIVVEFLKAVEQAKLGNLEPLKTFVQERLGEPWEDRLGVIQDFGFLEARKGEYSYGDAWAEETRRFMAADRGERGGEHYWYVVRAFGPGGKSRLVAHGRAATKAELDSLRKEWQVRDGDACDDTGYNAQEMYRFSMAAKWRAFKGEQRGQYIVPHIDPRNPQRRVAVPQIFCKSRAVVYNVQTKMRIGDIPLYLFADWPTQDLLMEYMMGLIGDWTIPKNVEKSYLEQIAAERREQKTDGKGAVSYFYHRYGDNHYKDCEKMILIAAIASKTINSPLPQTPK